MIGAQLTPTLRKDIATLTQSMAITMIIEITIQIGFCLINKHQEPITTFNHPIQVNIDHN